MAAGAERARPPRTHRGTSIVFFLLALCAFARPVAAQDLHLIVIVGVGGDDEHVAQFTKWADSVVDGAMKRGVTEANIMYYGERPEQDKRMRGRSTKENVTKAFQDTAKASKQADEVFVLLIGHGGWDGRAAAFNIPGPDLSPADYGVLLGLFPTQRIVFVNTASSSGAFTSVLAGPNRSIVTATKTGGERNETRFPGYFVEALDSEAADRDRNGRVSVLEAFEYAQTKVKEQYEREGHILTEHATLDDGNEGKFAALQYLSPRGSRAAATASADPALRALLEQRDALEEQVAELRLKKDSMEPARYEEQLEKLLTELAVKSKAIRDADMKKPEIKD